MECFRLLLEHLVWIEHQFLSGTRDSRKTGSLWGMMRGGERVRKSINQSWLTKGLGLGLLYWGFNGVQEEIPSEEASTLQIGSVVFSPGQCTSPQLHPCHRLFIHMGIKTVSQPPYSPDLAPCDFWLFPVVMRQLGRWKRLCRRSLTRSRKRTSMGLPEVVGTVEQDKCIAAGGDYFKGDLSFMCVLSMKVPIWKKSGNLFNDPRMFCKSIVCR